MSRRIARAIRRPGWSGEVIAVHRQSCYLRGAGAEISAIVQRPLGNGPLNLVIPASAASPLAALKPGAPVASTGSRLRVGFDLDIGLGGTSLWDPAVRLAPGADGGRLRRGLAGVHRSTTARAPAHSLVRLLTHLRADGLPAPLGAVAHFPRSHALIGKLIEALSNRDRRSLVAATSALAGLGPGLTPAGDDFIAGVLLALALLRTHRPDTALAEIADLVLEAAASRTHQISAAYLRAAHAGEASERWHRLIATISAGGVEEVHAAVGAVIEIGETSGGDTLAGFIAGMDAACGPQAVREASTSSGVG